MERREFAGEFKLEAVRLIKRGGRVVCAGVRSAWWSPDAVAQLGEAACGRPAACVPWPGSDEAGAVGDRAAQARGRQAEGRTRHPKKSRGLLHEGIDVKFGFIAKHRDIWPAE